MLDKIINISAPVPESPKTLAAQLESTKRPDSPRIATLYTSREKYFRNCFDADFKRPRQSYYEIPPLSEEDSKILYDVLIPETDELLRLNKKKARIFFQTKRVPSQKIILNFIREKGYADLIAKAENVGTSTVEGAYLVARDRRGTELSLSRVTNEESLEKQWQINIQEFGKNIIQKIEWADPKNYGISLRWRIRQMGFSFPDEPQAPFVGVKS